MLPLLHPLLSSPSALLLLLPLLPHPLLCSPPRLLAALPTEAAMYRACNRSAVASCTLVSLDMAVVKDAEEVLLPQGPTLALVRRTDNIAVFQVSHLAPGWPTMCRRRRRRRCSAGWGRR